MSVRLRQAVVAAAELRPTAEALRATLGLGRPYHDPQVALFGLRNAVFALGDTFVEVVSPTRPDTAAGRQLERHGDGGYMLIFQLDDLAAARRRAQAAGIRAVWEVDLPDIAATHLHPGDIGATIVSIDRPDPPGTWRWAGPAWTGRTDRDAPPGGLDGATLTTSDPGATADRWATVLGLERTGWAIPLPDGGRIDFLPGEERLVAVSVRTAAVEQPASRTVAGLRLDLRPA